MTTTPPRRAEADQPVPAGNSGPKGRVTVEPPNQRSNHDRVSRRQVDKFAERRNELAAAALRTLSELGYARTSLREIAQHSGFSHGVLHYYFSDKVDLIAHCVSQYKSVCVLRYDRIVTAAETADMLMRDFADGLAGSARDDAPLHRLWYDLRSQSMFEPSFRSAVVEIDDILADMVWRVLSRYAQLAQATLLLPRTAAYAVVDGLFQRALLRYLAGEASALTELIRDVQALLPHLLAAGDQPVEAARP